jgi:hypothetical protein
MREKEGLMDVGAALVANAQSSKAMKPTKGAFNDPMPATKPFTRLDAVPSDTSRDTSPAQPRAMCP